MSSLLSPTIKRFILLFFFLSAGLALFSLITPRSTYANPQFGITPTATSLPTETPVVPTPVPPTTEPDPDTDTDTDQFIDVQLECHLVCNGEGAPVTTEVQVQLIHRGSGWIAEGTINNSGSTTFRVPYGGEWDVYLVEPPRFASAGPFTDVGTLPQHVGVVNANSGVQYIPCPVSCLASNVPEKLPETGDSASHSNGVWSISFGLLLLLAGYRLKKMVAA